MSLNLQKNDGFVRNVLIGLIVAVLISICTSIFATLSNKIIAWFTSYSVTFNQMIYQQVALSNDQFYQQQVFSITLTLGIIFFSVISIVIIGISFLTKDEIRRNVSNEKEQLSLVALEQEIRDLRKRTLILSNTNIVLSSIVLLVALFNLSYNLMVNRYISESTNYFHYLLKVNADELNELERRSYISQLTQIKNEKDYLIIVKSLENKAFEKKKFIILNSIVRSQEQMSKDYPYTKAVDHF